MFQSVDPPELFNPFNMLPYQNAWNCSSLNVQRPIEVYQTNIKLAQLIIDMLSFHELQHAYKLASSLGEHIVAKLAYNCETGSRWEVNRDSQEPVHKLQSLYTPYSAPDMSILNKLIQNRPTLACATSMFHNLPVGSVSSKPEQPCSINGILDLRSEQDATGHCPTAFQNVHMSNSHSGLVRTMTTPLPCLNQLLNQQSFFPTSCTADAAIDLTMRDPSPRNRALSPSSNLKVTESETFQAYRATPEPQVSTAENVNGAAVAEPQAEDEVAVGFGLRSTRLRRPRVARGRKPRLVGTTSCATRQPKRRSSRTVQTGAVQARRFGGLRGRQPRRRYLVNSPTAHTEHEPTGRGEFDLVKANQVNSSAIGLRVTQPKPGRSPFTSSSPGYGALLTDSDYSTEHQMHRRQTCSTCRLQFEDSLSFVKHIQQVHLGIRLVERNAPVQLQSTSIIRHRAQWRAFEATGHLDLTSTTAGQSYHETKLKPEQ